MKLQIVLIKCEKKYIFVVAFLCVLALLHFEIDTNFNEAKLFDQAGNRSKQKKVKSSTRFYGIHGFLRKMEHFLTDMSNRVKVFFCFVFFALLISAGVCRRPS